MLIMEGLLRTRLLAILLTLSLGLVTQATAEPLSSPHDALVSELVVLKTTTWAPRGLTDSTKACEIAKDLALARLGAKLSDLRVVERTDTASFPSHLTCQWIRHARLIKRSSLLKYPAHSLSAASRQTVCID